MGPASRKKARETGLIRYRTGKPCTNGHVCDRYTYDGRCVECRHDQRLKWQKATGFHRKRNERRRHANPELHRERAKRWQRANPEAVRAALHARRARKRGAKGSYTKFDLHAILEKQGLSCYCGVSFLVVDPTVDHIVPLFRGGSNWPDNIQLLCRPCNESKGAKTMDEWKKAA
jgi:5-methylcytosine-specific restriction endonuclease McrA